MRKQNLGRAIRLESLESRKMLAVDACNFAASIDDHANFDLNRDDAGIVAANYQTADAAGSTFNTAANLGRINGTIRRNGSLNWLDRVDVVRFEVGQSSDVRILIDRMSGDADLFVLDGNGKQIASSTRAGSSNEFLSGKLRAGTYYMAITGGAYYKSEYRLSLSVEAFSLQRDSSAPPPSPSQSPSPASNATTDSVQPLQQVAYFGGSRDWNVNAVAAPEAWAAGYQGQGITVAVIDTGVDLDHPELSGNLFVNPGEIPGNGIDDDRNGYIDDVSGYDFVSDDARPDDRNGHGTHVAGTIAAGNDGIGVTGVAPEASILPVRVLDGAGSGSDSSVAAGIRYAAQLGAQIINLSLGGDLSNRIASAIEYATSLGSLIIAAAGNESASTPSFPAQFSASSAGVLSVGAYDSNNRIADFSNAVGSTDAVQIDAPGVRILGTYLGGGYATLSGTSMAAPHVAGVAALTLSANPDLTSHELRDLLSRGTYGRTTGSDSIGNASTLNSVAYAAAGFGTVGIANASTKTVTKSASTATAQVNHSRVAPTFADRAHVAVSEIRSPANIEFSNATNLMTAPTQAERKLAVFQTKASWENTMTGCAASDTPAIAPLPSRSTESSGSAEAVGIREMQIDRAISGWDMV